MRDSIRPAVHALNADAVAMRRDLHAHPELSTEEVRTQEIILERLRTLGLEDVRPIADTGATALIRGSKPGANILWRADIDGLPIAEDTGLPFAAGAEQRAMHACGHDGHVAIALAVAEVLAGRRDSLAGTVRFAFQPAEEHVGGAKRMVEAGIMLEPKVDRVFGLHIWAPLETGNIGVMPGAIFAAATHFRIIIRGRGGHASAPHQTIDPIVVAAHAIVALQTVVSRAVDPEQTAVLTVGRIIGGVRGNIIPNEVMMSGSIRTFEAGVLGLILRRIHEVLGGVTSAWGAGYQFDHSTLPATVHDHAAAALVATCASEMLGAEHVLERRTTGSEDMCYFLDAAPGAYFMLGGRDPERGMAAAHHSPQFDFDEACLPIGIELALRIIERATKESQA